MRIATLLLITLLVSVAVHAQQSTSNVKNVQITTSAKEAEVGQEIKLTDFVRLCTGFFAEIETKFL